MENGWSMVLRRLVREPLLHFFLIGIVLFLLFGRGTSDEGAAKRIVVDRALVAVLTQQFEATWHRPPTENERAGLVETYVHDEILYREGRSLGLDRDDPVIKQRVRQKIDVMVEEMLSHEPPSDAELLAYLQANRERLPAGLTSLEQARPLIVREWESARRTRALDEHYRRLREAYRVTMPKGASPK